MQRDIKAIKTYYKGYRFRSRLEARWAVLFDAGNIRWEYETEGYENDDGERYLPDFYLPDYGWHVEVKPPREGAKEDIMRASKFVDGKNIKVLLLLGNIPQKSDIEVYHYSAMYRNSLRCDNDDNRVTTERVCLTTDAECTKLEFVTWLGVDFCQKNLYQVEREYKEILTAIHDKEMYNRKGEDCAYIDCFYDDKRTQFINSCYDKARCAEFTKG